MNFHRLLPTFGVTIGGSSLNARNNEVGRLWALPVALISFAIANLA